MAAEEAGERDAAAHPYASMAAKEAHARAEVALPSVSIPPKKQMQELRRLGHLRA